MANKLIHTYIPLWLAILILLVVSGGVLGAYFYFGRVVYERDLFIDKGGVLQELEYGALPALSNPDFFNYVKGEFVKNSSDFVEANLSDMKIRVYEEGVLSGEFDILSKGKEGSWWETPAGLYKVQTKEESHFSSFGRVYQPWSMAFQGNFFIHGWPYYPGGEPVAPSYSGGCIRIGTEDAKAIYKMVEIGTPVLVFESDFNGDGFRYKVKTPAVEAASYLAVDVKSNFVLLKEDGVSEQLPIASITKLMTALVATEYMNIEKDLVVTQEMIVKTSKPRLKAGQTISVFQLLYPLLMESSNEAAEVLSQSMGENYFINLMNQKAEALGMTKTKFVDSSGVSAGNISSSEDLFALSKYLYNNRSFILKMTSGNLDRTVYGSSIYKDLENFNDYSWGDEFIGGKLGLSTDAQSTMLAVFEIDVDGERRPISIVVLGSQNSQEDINKIIQYIKSGYESN